MAPGQEQDKRQNPSPKEQPKTLDDFRKMATEQSKDVKAAIEKMRKEQAEAAKSKEEGGEAQKDKDKPKSSSVSQKEITEKVNKLIKSEDFQAVIKRVKELSANPEQNQEELQAALAEINKKANEYKQTEDFKKMLAEVNKHRKVPLKLDQENNQAAFVRFQLGHDAEAYKPENLDKTRKETATVIGKMTAMVKPHIKPEDAAKAHLEKFEAVYKKLESLLPEGIKAVVKNSKDYRIDIRKIDGIKRLPPGISINFTSTKDWESKATYKLHISGKTTEEIGVKSKRDVILYLDNKRFESLISELDNLTDK